jgi:hypothetical protein
MIITAGFDFIELLRPRFSRGRRPLVAIGMDGDLDVLFTKVVTPAYTGPLDAWHDAILAAVDKDFVRYFAIGHGCDHDAHEGPDDREAERLAAHAATVGLHLVGALCVNPAGAWGNTGPQSIFKTYVLEDDLPKITARRPRHFAKTRMRGGREETPVEFPLYEQFAYERREALES